MDKYKDKDNTANGVLAIAMGKKICMGNLQIRCEVPSPRHNQSPPVIHRQRQSQNDT